jgi:4-hydroxy-3-methylbut-2-en-1-yl diphosphate reductase
LEIIRAEKMGFCFGVQEAIKTVEERIKKSKGSKIYILGMLVHNKEVMNELEKKDIEIVEEENIQTINAGDTVVIRAHGTTKKIYEELEKKGVVIYDAACVFVKKSRKIISEMEEKGYETIFIGDKNHPEVIGIVSYGKRVTIFSDLEELKQFIPIAEKKYIILAQTTLNKNLFFEIKKYLFDRYNNIEFGDTICGATYERQIAVEKLAKEVDILLVVGGYNSSNTKKLYNIGKEINGSTYLIETKEDLKAEWLINKEKVGITAGASTPEKSIIEIENFIREEIWYGKY